MGVDMIAYAVAVIFMLHLSSRVILLFIKSEQLLISFPTLRCHYLLFERLLRSLSFEVFYVMLQRLVSKLWTMSTQDTPLVIEFLGLVRGISVCHKVFGDRLRSVDSVAGQKLPSPID